MEEGREKDVDENVEMLNNTATITSISLAGISGFLSIVLTLFLIGRHLKHWTYPEGQTYIVRILLMVPIYSFSSFLSLLFAEHTIYFNLVRDCYESFVLYQFFSLLVYYFDTAMKENFDVANDETTGDFLLYRIPFYHPFPCCCLPLIRPNHFFFRTVKQCILQYVIIKPLMTIIGIILEFSNLYEEGSISYKRGYLWITLITNISITISLYSLLLFYDTIVDIIEKEYKPLYKLLAIKILIFFIFWQSLIIDGLYHFNMMPRFLLIAEHDILSNCLVCFEMFLLSLANLSIFHYSPFKGNLKKGKRSIKLMLNSITHEILNPNDIVDDAKDAFLFL